MKKALLLVSALVSLSAVAGVEVQLKGGYDVFRRYAQNDQFFSKNDNVNDLQKGFVANVEVFPFNQYKVELGAGVEYNFNNSTYGYGFAKDGIDRRYHSVPVYGIIKANVLQAENGDAPLAIVGKLGYNFIKDVDKTHPTNDKAAAGGLYYALGFNGEYGPFVVEALASRTHLDKGVISSDSKDVEAKNTREGVINKVGITAGVRIGKLYNPVESIVEKPVEVVAPKVEMPKVETPKVEEPKVVYVPQIVEVIKEVPVVKEVIKEVPVVKEVIKEVPVTKVEKETPTVQKYTLEISADALFAFDRYQLKDMKPEGKAQIEKFASELNKVYSNVVQIDVVGHTDRLGSDAYNYQLGQRRATTVKNYLQSLGVKERIVATSKGKTQPKVNPQNSNLTILKQELAPNRRVEISVTGVKLEYEVQK
ncbi:MAG: OmpA family protein [Streptobacillus sp.]